MGDILIGGEDDFINDTFLISMRLPWNNGVEVVITGQCLTPDNKVFSSEFSISSQKPDFSNS